MPYALNPIKHAPSKRKEKPNCQSSASLMLSTWLPRKAINGLSAAEHAANDSRLRSGRPVRPATRSTAAAARSNT